MWYVITKPVANSKDDVYLIKMVNFKFVVLFIKILTCFISHRTFGNSNFAVKLAERSNLSSFSVNLMNNLFLSICQLNLENLFDCVNKKKKVRSNKTSFSINSCSIALSKTKLFPWLTLRKQLFFIFMLCFGILIFRLVGKNCVVKNEKQIVFP